MQTITDDFGNQIVLRTKNAVILRDYVRQNFALDQQPILASKLLHILRVAEACFDLGGQLGLDPLLCYNIGLLHDYGRFTQWQKYQSFNDHLTVDHADESVRLLFDDGAIKQFDLPPQEYDLIRVAIQNHNKKTINVAQIKALPYCQMIRDCDKLDIFYRLSYGDIQINLDTPGVSPRVIASIQKHQCVDKKDVRTGADRIVTFLGFFYDLYFPETLSRLDLPKFWQGLNTFYSARLNHADQNTVQKCQAIVQDYLANKG